MTRSIAPSLEVLKGISPIEREKIQCIFNAVLEYYEITKDDFYRLNSMAIINIRYELFFLIKENTDLGFSAISELINFDRKMVTYGCQKIQGFKDVYKKGLRNLDEVVKICNNKQDKKFLWLIHS